MALRLPLLNLNATVVPAEHLHRPRGWVPPLKAGLPSAPSPPLARRSDSAPGGGRQGRLLSRSLPLSTAQRC